MQFKCCLPSPLWPANSRATPIELLYPIHAAIRAGWRRDPHTSISLAKGGWKELQQEFVSMCQRRLYAGLVDFDDHLDDVSKDYMNPGLALLGKMALPGHLM